MTLFSYSSWLGKRIVPIIGVILMSYSISYHQGEKIRGVIWSDMEGYYLYLPAVFINGGFKDLKCYSGCSVPNKELGWVHTKYTYGVAVLELPFFAIAHVIASTTTFENDGYSKPYAYALLASGLFYFLIGLLLLRKFLLKRFSTWPVNLVLLSIGLGTNAYYYATVGAGMSHIYSFFLFSLLLILTESWQGKRGFAITLGLALVSALIVLIRPTGIIMLLWIPFSGLKDMAGFKGRLHYLFTSGLAFLIPILGFLLFLPQLFYWQAFSGNFFTYSYGNEGFSHWANPKIFQVLFSHQNGLLMYSPIIALALVGLYPMWKKQRSNTLLIISVFLVATYTFASWWAWWFGGAFGHRSYVEYFAVLAIPMAYFYSWAGKAPFWIKLLGVVLFLASLYANARMVFAYRPPWDGVDWTWERYWKIWEWIF